MTRTIAAEAAHERFVEMTTRSGELFERALDALPGGNSRTTIYMQPHPIYVERGEGCRLIDVDGNERIDFINNYTSLILGHCHPAVVKAVQDMAGLMMSAAAPSELEIELAELIEERIPSIDLLRFTNSGTEGTMMAIRAARAFTGRTKIAKFEGGYHGTHDYAAVDGSTAGASGTGTQTSTGGLPAAVADTVLIAPYNDADRTEAILAAHRDDLAAVIIEPVMGAAGVIPANEDFLVFLRELTQSFGGLLIFDEVISFRTGYGGAQGRYGVKPDLTTLGKIIGGGLPVGAFGGREDIMAQFDPRRPGYLGHGGTFNANPLSMAAGLATLAELTPDRYDQLEALGAELKTKLDALFASLGLAAQVTQVGSLFNIHLTDQAITDSAAANTSDRALVHELYVAMLNHGVAFTGRGMGCLSTPMGRAEIDAFVEAARLGLADLGVAG
jgi:glutamate-1-semialdehyde 2,1-aminomutase